MVNQSIEQLLINLQSTVRKLEKDIEAKNKEIVNLKGLIYKLQDTKESKSN
jgi:hypothetical protein